MPKEIFSKPVRVTQEGDMYEENHYSSNYNRPGSLNGHGGRCTADSHGPAGQSAKMFAAAGQSSYQETEHNRGQYRQREYENRPWTKSQDVTEGNAKAQQGDANTQQGAPAELDTGHGPRVVRNKVERHTQQQREQHCRRAVVFTEKARRKADGERNSDAPRLLRHGAQRSPQAGLQVLRITFDLSHYPAPHCLLAGTGRRCLAIELLPVTHQILGRLQHTDTSKARDLAQPVRK